MPNVHAFKDFAGSSHRILIGLIRRFARRGGRSAPRRFSFADHRGDAVNERMSELRTSRRTNARNNAPPSCTPRGTLNAMVASAHSPFVEQAEYIDPPNFEAWSTEHPEEESILRKLSQAGAKLLTGPRGSGKTTFLLKAFHRMMRSADAAFPVYVNFRSSLKLEPLYRTNSDAVYLFNQWLLLKIYQGLYESLRATGRADFALSLTRQAVETAAGQLELGKTSDVELASGLNLSSLEEDVTKILQATTRPRCVLLLDDAAHAFSAEQQRDFFDFFRQLKSRTISPKAAIYPGVTIYSSTFHVGHDAEQIDVWIRPDLPIYLSFMSLIAQRRLSAADFGALQSNRELFELLCFAAFGMPRALLNMLSSFQRTDEEASGLSITRTTAVRAIKDVADNTLSVFRSLSVKLPLYSEFVTTGEIMFSRIVESIKIYNKEKPTARKSVTVAIPRPVPAEIARVLAFFQYSGLVMPRGEVSRGEKGVFELYAVHYASLVERNALFGKKALNIGEYAEAFKQRHPHEFTRASARGLLGNADLAEAFPLSLPPCQVCHTPRVNEAAKFCLACGAQLKSVSAFDSIVSRDIGELPLTEARVGKIKANSRIRTIKDVLMDHENRELRSVPRIGPYWAQRIYAYAEEAIA